MRLARTSAPGAAPPSSASEAPLRVAHLTTVDSSLLFLLLPQLRSVLDQGGQAMGISAGGPWVPELEANGVIHRALPSSTRGWSIRSDLQAARDLWRILREERVDVLHTHNPKPGLYGRVVGRLAGVPVVVHTTHGLYAAPDDHWARRGLVYAAEAIASRFSDAELVQNPEDLALMTRLRLVPRCRAALLGNGVNLERFRPDGVDPAAARAVRAEAGFGSDRILVGTVGRLVTEKGYLELFTAMEMVGDPYSLLVVGPEDPDKPDSLPPHVLDEARARGVVFFGMRRDVEAIYAALDIFVLASHREGLPRAAMEAAAMGVPIVATDIRGCRQVVEDGANGLLVPRADAGALAAAIARLGRDEHLRARMGRAGVEKARRSFDERTVVGLVNDTYRSVIARKGVTGLRRFPLRRG
jgi:glycosyltransferase involved in cell wall biosynthesis